MLCKSVFIFGTLTFAGAPKPFREWKVCVFNRDWRCILSSFDSESFTALALTHKRKGYKINICFVENEMSVIANWCTIVLRQIKTENDCHRIVQRWFFGGRKLVHVRAIFIKLPWKVSNSSSFRRYFLFLGKYCLLFTGSISFKSPRKKGKKLQMLDSFDGNNRKVDKTLLHTMEKALHLEWWLRNEKNSSRKNIQW